MQTENIHLDINYVIIFFDKYQASFCLKRKYICKNGSFCRKYAKFFVLNSFFPYLCTQK